jgi:hypothetical protein
MFYQINAKVVGKKCPKCMSTLLQTTLNTSLDIINNIKNKSINNKYANDVCARQCLDLNASFAKAIFQKYLLPTKNSPNLCNHLVVM